MLFTACFCSLGKYRSLLWRLHGGCFLAVSDGSECFCNFYVLGSTKVSGRRVFLSFIHLCVGDNDVFDWT